MSARAEQADQFVRLSLPAPLRWLGAAALMAVTIAAISKVRQRARQPTVPPMSAEWLQSHAADRGYQSYD
jgi:hypothetical protein